MYLCDQKDCVKTVTTRVRLRVPGELLGYADVCDEHATMMTDAAKRVSSTAKITHSGYLTVDEHGEDINKGKVH